MTCEEIKEEVKEENKGLKIVYYGSFEGDLFDAFRKCASHDISNRYRFFHTSDPNCVEKSGPSITFYRNFSDSPVKNESPVLYTGGSNDSELIAFAEKSFIP